MTFLEFACRRLIGKPINSRWVCPWCAERKLELLPPKDGCKDRVACRNPKCQPSLADIVDIIRNAYPDKSFSEAVEHERLLRAKYEKSDAFDPSLQEYAERGDVLLEAAYSELNGSVDKNGLLAVVTAFNIANERGVLLRDLAVHTAKKLRRRRTASRSRR